MFFKNTCIINGLESAVLLMELWVEVNSGLLFVDFQQRCLVLAK